MLQTLEPLSKVRRVTSDGLHQALDKYTKKAEKRVKDQFQLSINESMKTGDLETALSEITSGKSPYLSTNVMQRLSSFELNLRALETLIRDTTMGSARITGLRAGFGVTFDPTLPDAIAVAQKNAARMVQDINKSTQDTIREMVVRSLGDGTPPYELAERIKTVIGLTKPHAAAVSNYLQSLLDTGASRTRANQMAKQYAGRLLDYRAKSIARTETMIAANTGQSIFWQQMKSLGFTDGMVREWITTADEKTCPLCAPMNGKHAPIDGFFQSGDGPLISPPRHVQCRCTTGLVYANEDELSKMNPNHDRRGRFAPGPGGAAGGLTTPAGKPEALFGVKTYRWGGVTTSAFSEPADRLLSGNSAPSGKMLLQTQSFKTKEPTKQPKYLTLDEYRSEKKHNIQQELGRRMVDEAATNPVLAKWLDNRGRTNVMLKRIYVKQKLYEWSMTKGQHYSWNQRREMMAKKSKEFEQEYSHMDKAAKRKMVAEMEVNTQVQSWAGASGDNNSRSIAMQVAIQRKFGTKATMTHIPGRKAGALEYSRNKPFYDSFVNHVYAHTQAKLKQAGITSLTLFRGMEVKTGVLHNVTGKRALKPLTAKEKVKLRTSQKQLRSLQRRIDALRRSGKHDWDTSDRLDYLEEQKYIHEDTVHMLTNGRGTTGRARVNLQPASSFSAGSESALGFGGTLIAVRVSAKRVFSTAITGPGCLTEGEFIVIGDKNVRSRFAMVDSEAF